MFFIYIRDIINWAAISVLLRLFNYTNRGYDNDCGKKFSSKNIPIFAFEVTSKVDPVLIREMGEKKGLRAQSKRHLAIY